MTTQNHPERLSIGASGPAGDRHAAEAPRDDYEPSPAPFDDWELARAVLCDALFILVAVMLLAVALFPFVTGN